MVVYGADNYFGVGGVGSWVFNAINFRVIDRGDGVSRSFLKSPTNPIPSVFYATEFSFKQALHVKIIFKFFILIPIFVVY